MILVTGATGTVGSEVVSQLCSAGAPVRALVRTPERADTLRGYDCEVAVGDYDDPGSLDAAMAGVDRVFLVAPPGEGLAIQEGRVIAAAQRAGGVHVVKLGALGADEGGFGRFVDEHVVSLGGLQASGLPYTVIAPNAFMHDLLQYAAAVQERQELALPGGQAAVSLVDAADVAAVAAHVLTSDGHEGASYPVTGPEALTWNEVAVALSRVTGREVRYVDLPPEEARRRLLEAGTSPWQADALLELYAAWREGKAAKVTDEVRRATGRPATPLADFLDRHRSAFA